MKKFLWLVLLLPMFGCNEEWHTQALKEKKAYTGPELVDIAPDGTKLWKARVYERGDDNCGYDLVYFSSQGTQRTMQMGKLRLRSTVANAAD